MKASVPTEAVNVYNNALNFSNDGDFMTALIEYRKAIKIYPRFIEAYNNIGEIYSRQGNRNLAITTYLQALDIERNYRVLLNLGVEYYNNREYRTALNFFEESLAKNENFNEGNFYTGITYFNLEDYKSAEKYFSRVVQSDKKHLKANYLLAYIYYEWKDYARTLQCLDCIKDIADDKAFLNKYYGFCYYHLGMFDKAVKYLQTALESSPKYAQFKNYLKKVTYENKLKEIGDVKKKIAEMEDKMMKQKPTLREYTHLSMLYIFQGEYKKAETLLTSYKKEMQGKSQ